MSNSLRSRLTTQMLNDIAEGGTWRYGSFIQRCFTQKHGVADLYNRDENATQHQRDSLKHLRKQLKTYRPTREELDALSEDAFLEALNIYYMYRTRQMG